jgi:nucleoside-diphosphate-sugar epimerase
MKLLVIGGAGYVGSILQPALEARHQCRYLDLKPVAGAEDRSIIGDINNMPIVEQALNDIECVVWLALGVTAGKDKAEGSVEIDAAFDVNVKAMYRVLLAAGEAGVQRFVYASSFSVFRSIGRRHTYPVYETERTDAWHAYGVSKQLGERLGQMWSEQQPAATFLSLRLFWPRSEEDWPGNEYNPAKRWYPIGPNDLRRLFVAGVACEVPGFHIVHASGDLDGHHIPYEQGLKLLGWQPQGR